LMPPQNPQARIPEHDGLRGTAIFLVLTYHYVDTITVTHQVGFRYYVEHLFRLGWTGVDLFFVLSGFLIGGILRDVRSSSSYFRTFYIRRFFRIIPLYYAWILAYILLVSVAGAAVLAQANRGALTKPNALIYEHFLFLQNFSLLKFAGLASAWFVP